MAAAQASYGPKGDPLERRLWIPAYCSVFVVTASLFVALRLLTRLTKAGGGFGLDDVFVFLGWIVATAMTIMFAIGAAHFGYDGHISGLTKEQTVQAAAVGWFGQAFYVLSTNFTKIAVLLFYRRLIQTSISKGLRWAIWIALGFTIAYLISFEVSVLTICSPIEANWKRFDANWLATRPHYKCRMDHRLPDTFSGAFSAFGDFYALLIPAVLLSGLAMPRRQKIGLYCVFALGITVVIAGVVRTIYLYITCITPDVTWYAANTFICSIAEMQLALICACAPSLRAVFKRYFNVKLPSYIRKVSSKTGNSLRSDMKYSQRTKSSGKLQATSNSTMVTMDNMPLEYVGKERGTTIESRRPTVSRFNFLRRNWKEDDRGSPESDDRAIMVHQSYGFSNDADERSLEAPSHLR